jgi:hypothetical protein
MNLQYITDAFLKYHRRSLSQAWEINTGKCFRWATICHKLNGGKLFSVTMMIDWFGEGEYCEDCSHAFVMIDGLYYDSESVSGVRDWRQLKYFQRIDNANCRPTYYYYKVKCHSSIKAFNKFWKPNRRMKLSDKKLLKMIENQ